MQRVVILGGGFGGLYAAKALHDAPVDVTLLDKRNFHLFQPLLYQVASGSLSPGEIAAPLRSLLRHQKNTRVLLGEAIDLDVDGRKVILSDGAVAYDTLIVATGARNSYFGHDDWRDAAPGLKSLEDAAEVRRKVFYAFEAAEREDDAEIRRAWLTFLIVGAGPTGVELSGALAEIANDTLKRDFRAIHPEESRIILLDGGSRVLAGFPEDLSAQAERSLIRLGVLSRTGVKVTGIDGEGVTLESGEKIPSRTVIWAAGVTTSPLADTLAAKAGARLDRQNRVLVEPDLTIAGHPEIFVVGDMAHCEDKGQPLPGVCPVAMQQGRYAASVVIARLKNETPPPFRYWFKGNLAVIGRQAGVADFRRFHFHGVMAWLLWLFVHIMYLAQFRNRVLVFIRWGFQYLTFDHGARLITGTPKDIGR